MVLAFLFILSNQQDFECRTWTCIRVFLDLWRTRIHPATSFQIQIVRQWVHYLAGSFHNSRSFKKKHCRSRKYECLYRMVRIHFPVQLHVYLYIYGKHKHKSKGMVRNLRQLLAWKDPEEMGQGYFFWRLQQWHIKKHIKKENIGQRVTDVVTVHVVFSASQR